jgi:hypothetical protein
VTRSFATGLIFGVMALVLLAFHGCAHAQQGSWRRPETSTVRTPDPVVKVCTEERITTMADVDRIEEGIRERGGRLCK